MLVMSKPKQQKKPVPVYPSRELYTSVTLPKKLADELRTIAAAQDRSVAYIVKKACETYRDAYRKKAE